MPREDSRNAADSLSEEQDSYNKVIQTMINGIASFPKSEDCEFVKIKPYPEEQKAGVLGGVAYTSQNFSYYKSPEVNTKRIIFSKKQGGGFAVELFHNDIKLSPKSIRDMEKFYNIEGNFNLSSTHFYSIKEAIRALMGWAIIVATPGHKRSLKNFAHESVNSLKKMHF